MILLTCAPSLHLLLHLFLSLWLSGIVSQLSTKQTSFPLFLYNPLSASWAWLRPGFVQKTQQPQLPSLTISLSLTPHVRLAGMGALVCSFQIIGNTQPTRPYVITTPLPVTFRRNLRSLSPSHLSSVVSSSLPSPTHFSSLDVNAATDTLCSTLTTCLDDICPLSSRRARTAPSNSWLSDVLREHRTRLRAAERKWRKSNEPSDLSMYQSFLSSFSAEVHTAKSSHFNNKINNAPDMRNLFRTFNSLLCPPPPPPTTSITADDFATFFTNKTKTISSQFSPPLTQDLQPTTSTAQTPIFSFCPLTEAEVSKLLLSSHPTTCPLDPIPSHLLQAISPALLPALTHIINTSLLTGIFPTAFKQARVTPLLKKPTLNTSLLENYRPVSLLPFIDKTLERVVFNQVSLFLSQNNKLDAKQSGFRSGHSTETALLSVTEALRIAKADSKSSVLILLDLSAAFDTVNHQILLSTLSSLDITGIPLRWFESYLTGRSFRVAWGGEVSKANKFVTGVPQGSVLGPLLFSTYTTSLAPIIQAHGFSYHFYADDTRLYLSFWPDDPTVAARISGCLAKDWASCLPCNSNSTAWFHDSVRFINNYPISFGQKSWCNLRWPADLQRAHCKDCSILQVCTTQHQKDQALSDRACCTTSCPGPCHF